MEKTLHPRNPILVIDDEISILMSIDTTLRMNGLNNIITCQDSRKVTDIFKRNEIGAILLDLNMPNIGGESLMTTINHDYPNIPIIIVTGDIDVETAVRCMKSGAFDYVIKPVKKERLVSAVIKALDYRELKQENVALKQRILSDKLENPDAFSEIISKNKKINSIFQYLESISMSFQPVLITGETGVGKELFARAIHRLSGMKGQLVAVNVAGLDDNVFSDTLFGHIRGAFTGADSNRTGLIEQANGGTLFLDEIGDLGISSQVKLLRLLQEGEYIPLGLDTHKKSDARIVVATNRDLWELQKKGKFREDLIYRLLIHHVHIPPLKERLDDLPLLTDHFLQEATKMFNKKILSLPKEFETFLKIYAFPGNVRELKAIIYDTVSRAKDGIITMDSFKSHMSKQHPRNEIHEIVIGEKIVLPQILPTIKELTTLLVNEALKRAENNQTVAAKMLGITHQALSKRLRMRSNRKKNGSDTLESDMDTPDD